MSCKVVTVVAFEPLSSVPPPRVTVAPLSRRFVPVRTRLPEAMFTAAAPNRPLSVVMPSVTFAVPAPRLLVTVPPCSA